MRSAYASVAGGECGHPAIRNVEDFKAWARAGCPEQPRLRWHTVGEFLEWAHAKRWPDHIVEKILTTAGRLLGVTAGSIAGQGALNGQVFTATSATAFVVPDNTPFMLGAGWGGGGGGGGGGSNATQAAGGGGGAGAIMSVAGFASTPGASINVTCGAAGGSGSGATGTVGSPGGAGADSTIGSLATFGGASGGAGGNVTASTVTGGGLCTKANGGANQYGTVQLTTAGITSTIGAFIGTPAGGGFTESGAHAGNNGALNCSGGFASGTGGGAATAGGGGGGGAGPGGAGANAGAGVASGTANSGSNAAAANGGAGGGGGGGQATATSASGPGGFGGAGQVTLLW
jgi:hypothetical protein